MDQNWNEKGRAALEGMLRDPVLVKLLEKSNLTRVQFETVLLDQLGSDLADKELTHEEMSELRLAGEKISRGAFNRSLSQARANIAESIHTVLLLGYAGLLESPGLACFVEASESLRAHLEEIRGSIGHDESHGRFVESLLVDLEQAMDSLFGRERDT